MVEEDVGGGLFMDALDLGKGVGPAGGGGLSAIIHSYPSSSALALKGVKGLSGEAATALKMVAAVVHMGGPVVQSLSQHGLLPSASSSLATLRLQHRSSTP